MQQTENLKLNLIETGDPISPAPLNENAEKIEAALRTKTGAAETAVLTQRVVELEKLHFACGEYTGDGVRNHFIPLGFTPSVVILYNGSNDSIMITYGTTRLSGVVVVEEGGFSLISSASGSYNYSGHIYSFLAMGQDK